MKICLFLVTVFCLCSAFASQQTVTMKSISFDPKLIRIGLNDEVQWINKAHTQHSATADDGTSFDTGLIGPGEKSYKIKFTKPGTFPYHCSIHGAAMKGQIIVAPDDSGNK